MAAATTPAGGTASAGAGELKPEYALAAPEARAFVGDCREILRRLPEVARSSVDLVFADPPFNWNRDYDRWKKTRAGGTRAEYEAAYKTWGDRLPREDYLLFTYEWIDLCIAGLRPGGALWINIPDDTAAEIVVHVRSRGLEMRNWCVWHYRFGQNRTGGFINSKVHALYFCKPGGPHTWNPERILEPSDRASIYFDPRTLEKKDGIKAGHRVPMDVWYGAGWGRIQGNNKERRGKHDNQLPEAYLERVVLSTSKEGDLVLDPFLGSGTTGVVARAYGRRFIGCEFSAANARSAFARIEQGMVNKGKYLGLPTAIFKARGAGERTRQRFAHTHSHETDDTTG
jgi:DNA modification methylase